MSLLRRQRLNKLLQSKSISSKKMIFYNFKEINLTLATTSILSMLIIIILVQVLQASSALSFQFNNGGSNKQYQIPTTILSYTDTRSLSPPLEAAALTSTLNQQRQHLVINNNEPIISLAQSLPLIKQQPQQPDLDNVIESTTTNLLLTQQFNSKQTSNNNNNNNRCQLPPTWAGKWFQSNKEPIRITNSEISDKGICRDQKGDKYLFEYNGINNNKQQSCYYCLVINERHLNVLQYKESSCQSNANNQTINSLMNRGDSASNYVDHSLLDSICSEINGDATLESLFRLDAPAIECPITGQYSFNYDSCREPQSSIDSCIDKKQLNFKFSACQDVPGSESKTEVLKCYADWSEGNNYYMIGRLEYSSVQQDNGEFRCFVYEKSSDGKYIQMAQTLEENCYGLLGPNEGPKVLRLTAKPPTTHKCHFPSYIQSLSENWLSVDNSLIYIFNQNSTKYQVKETKEGKIIEEATCLQQFSYPQPSSNHHSQHPHLLNHQQQHTRSNNQHQVLSQNRKYQTSTITYPQADQSSFQITSSQKPTTTINDVVYLVQITKNCHTTNYCVRFYRRSNGIVQIDYFSSPPNGDNQCRISYTGTPQTQIITSTNIENQRCPFEGFYSIDAPIESDLTFNPSNIFICPRQSFLTAQCDHPSKLKIHSKCSPTRYSIKNLYCLGSWTTGGLVRLLLADDDRQRYSAWYKDYSPLQVPIQDGAIANGELIQPLALQQQQQQQGLTRSQQLLNGANIVTTTIQPPINIVNSFSTIVDLHIALITPLPIAVKTMQVRLTRRYQCSDLARSNSGISNLSPSSIQNGASSLSMLSYSSQASSASSNIFTSYSSKSCSIILLIVTIIFIFKVVFDKQNHHIHYI